MTRTRTIAAVASLLLLLGASIGVFWSSRPTHEIVIPPVQGVLR